MSTPCVAAGFLVSCVLAISSARSLFAQTAQLEERPLSSESLHGDTLVDWEYNFSVTAPGSLRLDTRLLSPDGMVYHQFGYLVPGHITYLIATTSPDDVESPAFRQFVNSFHVLAPSLAVVRVPAAIVIGRPIYIV